MAYIEIKRAIAEIDKGDLLVGNNAEWAKEILYRTPTADVVEVVRCKDCKYCMDAIMGGMWCEHPDNIMPLGSNPDDFCSYGERVTDINVGGK